VPVSKELPSFRVGVQCVICNVLSSVRQRCFARYQPATTAGGTVMEL
jgi:hypothetical protein